MRKWVCRTSQLHKFPPRLGASPGVPDLSLCPQLPEQVRDLVPALLRSEIIGKVLPEELVQIVTRSASKLLEIR